MENIVQILNLNVITIFASIWLIYATPQMIVWMVQMNLLRSAVTSNAMVYSDSNATITNAFQDTLCDGIDNCGDGSNENNMTICSTKQRPCLSLTEYMCANKNCIDKSQVCDLTDDCGDSSDELGCHHTNVCTEDTRGGCQHRCMDLTDGGYIYVCQTGFIISKQNKKLCKDIDECATGSHVCSQNCINRNGTYECSCQPGFKLVDGQSGVCKALLEPPLIIFANGPEIKSFDLQNREENDVINQEKRIEAIDYNPKTQMIFWADTHDKTIKRSYMINALDRRVKIGYAQDLEMKGSAKPTSVAVDWVGDNLYWTEIDLASPKPKGRVMVAKTDGRYRRSVVTGSVKNPTSIAVAPQFGKMIWSDAGSEPKLKMSWMDGSKIRTLVSENIRHPTELTIDYGMGHNIFWVDTKLNTIESMWFDGSNRKSVLRGEFLKHPISLNVFESSLYWVTRDTGELMHQDKFGRGIPSTVLAQLTNPSGVKSIDVSSPIINMPTAICPPNAELVAGVCKCNQDLCEKPPCDKILNVAKIDSENPENCCPTYTCDDCILEFFVDGKCICPENSTLNSKGICECDDPYESIQNTTCQCDLNKCPLPNLCNEHSVGISLFTGCCTFIECKACPSDSYPKRYNSDLIEDKCVCYICPETSCEKGHVPKYIKRGRNIPGDCCDIYECVPADTMFEKNCFINYTLYHHMESWMEDECKNCTCFNGESICISETSNEHCRASNTLLEDNCIVNETLYHHLDTWFEDECTNCTCFNGKPKCMANFCDSKISVVPTECPLVNCKKSCKYGYKLNKKGCQICKCTLSEHMNKEMDYFMHSHNLTDDDVLAILKMYMKNKNVFGKHVATTTVVTNEVFKIPPKYELLEIFMNSHNLTERDVLEMLDVHFQNKHTENSTDIKTTSYTDNTHWLGWAIGLITVVFATGFVFGWFLHYCKKRFQGHEEHHDNNNVVKITKKSSRPKEQAIHTNEKKPLTIT